MILRYGVELTTRPTFTASKRVNNEEEADKEIAWMRKHNSEVRRRKYFNPALYSDNNDLIKKYSL